MLQAWKYLTGSGAPNDEDTPVDDPTDAESHDKFDGEDATVAAASGDGEASGGIAKKSRFHKAALKSMQTDGGLQRVSAYHEVNFEHLFLRCSFARAIKRFARMYNSNYSYVKHIGIAAVLSRI